MAAHTGWLGPAQTSPPHPAPAAPLSQVSLWAISRWPRAKCSFSPPFPRGGINASPHSQATPKTPQLCSLSSAQPLEGPRSCRQLTLELRDHLEPTAAAPYWVGTQWSCPPPLLGRFHVILAAPPAGSPRGQLQAEAEFSQVVRFCSALCRGALPYGNSSAEKFLKILF